MVTTYSYYAIWFTSIKYDANKKSNTPSNIYISKYNEIRSLYPQHIAIFTYGSKQSNHTATAVVLKYYIITKRLPNSVSIYPAELYAILLALN